jgi:ketosteroid isomerase-like protein
MDALLNELVEIEKQCATAFNENNISGIIQYFSDQISGFSSTEHDRFKSKEELKKTFEYYLAEADSVTYEILEPIVTEAGNVAILSFYWRVTLKTGNKRVEIPGRGSHVFQKENGQWKIIHEHFSRTH